MPRPMPWAPGPTARGAIAAIMGALLLAGSALPALAQDPGANTLGQVDADFELHGDLVLVSGQLEGFEAACGFGPKPNRQELITWYDHHKLARNPARIEAIYELGVSIGRDGPCTQEHGDALVREWRGLLDRTAEYVQQYR